MLNLIHAEFYKMRKSSALKICVLITITCAVILCVLSNCNATGKTDIPESSMSGLSDVFILSVVGTLMTSLLICSDFENKNIHDAISCGRRSIVISKTVSYCVLVGLLILPYAVVGFVGFVSQGQFEATFTYSTYLNLMANKAGYAVNGANIGKSIEMLIVSIILYAARLSFCIPLAFKIRKAVVVTVVGVIVGFVSDFIMNVMSKVPVLDTIVEYTPFSYPMVELNMSQGELIKILAISVVFIILMVLLTYRIFKKDEIK